MRTVKNPLWTKQILLKVITPVLLFTMELKNIKMASLYATFIQKIINQKIEGLHKEIREIINAIKKTRKVKEVIL